MFWRYCTRHGETAPTVHRGLSRGPGAHLQAPSRTVEARFQNRDIQALLYKDKPNTASPYSSKLSQGHPGPQPGHPGMPLGSLSESLDLRTVQLAHLPPSGALSSTHISSGPRGPGHGSLGHRIHLPAAHLLPNTSAVPLAWRGPLSAFHQGCLCPWLPSSWSLSSWRPGAGDANCRNCCFLRAASIPRGLRCFMWNPPVPSLSSWDRA